MISVIIPALNEESCIERTLCTVAAAPGDKEIIVADGGSSDSTVAIASRFGRVVRSERGRAAQMNAGAREARGDVLLFLHADCLFPRSGFASLQNALADPRVIGGNFDLIFHSESAIHTPGRVPDETSPVREERDAGVPHTSLLVRERQEAVARTSAASRIFTLVNRWRRHFGIFYGDSGIFVRADVFREMGGYRPLELMEDYEFARRLVKRGRTAFVRDPLRVSARRWEEAGVLNTLATWTLIHTAYLLGVPPKHLARLYPNVRIRTKSP